MITTSSDTSNWTLDRTLAIISRLYPSLKVYQVDINALIDTLAGQIGKETSIYRKRQFIFTLLDGLPYFKDNIEFAICPVLKETDLLTRHLAKVRVAGLTGIVEPLTISTYRRQVISGETQNTVNYPADMETGQYLHSLCGEDISALKPKLPQLERIIEPTDDENVAPTTKAEVTDETSR